MDINYRVQWQEMMQNKTSSQGGNPYLNEKAAKNYDSSILIRKDGIKRANEMDLLPNDAVLDIGAGPGVLSLPIAKRVKSVTVVEPSKAMVDILKQHMDEEKISNINIINSRWEDIDEDELGKFDVVIASYSLMMEDLAEAILRMNKLASRQVYLYWFCGSPEWEKVKIDMYPKIHNIKYIPGPKSDIIYGILSDLGISSNVQDLTNTCFPYTYPNIESALRNMRNRVDISENDSSYDQILEEYIKTHYIENDNGSYQFVDNTHYVKISWNPI